MSLRQFFQSNFILFDFYFALRIYAHAINESADEPFECAMKNNLRVRLKDSSSADASIVVYFQRPFYLQKSLYLKKQNLEPHFCAPTLFIVSMSRVDLRNIRHTFSDTMYTPEHDMLLHWKKITLHNRVLGYETSWIGCIIEQEVISILCKR